MDRQRFIQEAGNLNLVIANRVRDTKIVPAILVMLLCKLAHAGLTIGYDPLKLAKDSTMLLNVGVVSFIMTLVLAYIIWVLSFGYRMAPMSQLKVGKRMHTLAVVTMLVAIFSFVLTGYMAMNLEDILAFQSNPQAILTNQAALIFGVLSLVSGIFSLIMLVYGIMVLVDMVKFKLPLYKPLLVVIIVSIVIATVTGAVTSGAAIANPNFEGNPVLSMATQASVGLTTLLHLYLLFSLYKVVTAK